MIGMTNSSAFSSVAGLEMVVSWDSCSRADGSGRDQAEIGPVRRGSIGEGYHPGLVANCRAKSGKVGQSATCHISDLTVPRRHVPVAATQEQALLAAVSRTSTYDLGSDPLMLRHASGATQLTLMRADS
jgi:hypothetical protein